MDEFDTELDNAGFSMAKAVQTSLTVDLRRLSDADADEFLQTNGAYALNYEVYAGHLWVFYTDKGVPDTELGTPETLWWIGMQRAHRKCEEEIEWGLDITTGAETVISNFAKVEIVCAVFEVLRQMNIWQFGARLLEHYMDTGRRESIVYDGVIKLSEAWVRCVVSNWGTHYAMLLTWAQITEYLEAEVSNVLDRAGCASEFTIMSNWFELPAVGLYKQKYDERGYDSGAGELTLLLKFTLWRVFLTALTAQRRCTACL